MSNEELEDNVAIGVRYEQGNINDELDNFLESQVDLFFPAEANPMIQEAVIDNTKKD